MHFAAKVLLRVLTYVANISHDPPGLSPLAASWKLQKRGAISGPRRGVGRWSKPNCCLRDWLDAHVRELPEF
jgi:hypothetical protein